MARTFYHNVGGNTAAANFNITRIYPNKQELIGNAVNDGVYPGSYVLIDYDKDYNPATYDVTSGKWSFDPSFAYKLGWETEADDYYEPTSGHYLLLSTDPETGQEIYYLYSNDIVEEVDDPFYGSSTKALKITKGTVIYVEHYTGQSGKSAYHYDFYRCTGKATSITDGENPRPEYAEFEKLREDEYGFDQNTGIVRTGLDAYTENYQKDRATYGNIGRGYDGTVWQKAVVNGVQTYIQIAELNSAVPTFNFNVVPPEEDGISPYVDYNISSNMYYEMYDSPHWGFRVKDANYVSSRTVDTTNYPHEDDSDKAIYWNEDGFDSEHIGKDTTNTDNLIKVAPTGISGREYDKPEGTAPDIQELSIILPELGNTISDIWDIVYGDSEINSHKWELNQDAGLNGYDVAYTNQRIQERDWHNANESEEEKTEGLRFVKKTGNPASPYAQPEGVETLVGCINSIHDLMGMIIYDPDSDPEYGDEVPVSVDREDAAALEAFRKKWAELSSDYIYYLGGDYYRRGTAVGLDENYDPDDLWREVQVSEYDPNTKYFYKDLTNYIRVVTGPGEIPSDDIVCYKFNNESNDMQLVTDLGSEFELNKYYYLNEFDTSWNLETSSWREGVNYYSLAWSYASLVFWKPGIYYTKINPSGPVEYSNLQISNLTEPDENTVYYYPYNYRNYNAALGRYETTSGYAEINGSEFTVFHQSDSYKYYYQDPVTKYTPISYSNVQDYMWKAPDNFDPTEQIRYKCPYAVINNELSQLDHPINFYRPNVYYYKSVESDDSTVIYDYLVDTNNKKQADRVYYKKNNEPVAVGKFYEPYKFYDHEHNLHYIGYDANETYYEEEKLYVISSNGSNGRLYKVGSEWVVDDGQRKTPQHLLSEYGVVCGVKNIYYEPYRLTGFARNINTIHGILLRLDAIIGDSNNNDLYLNGELTRDTNTIRGCINQLNDYIDLFDTVIKPDHIMMADKTGKYGTAEITSDAWILLDTSGQTESRLNSDTNEYEDIYIGPQLEITHKSAVIDTSAATAIDLNTTGSDTVNLLVTDFDAKGHATAKKVQTVILPFGFKKLKSSAQSGNEDVWSSAAQSTDITIEADNTQDELTIATGNKWIRTIADAANDSLTIGHETHIITGTISNQDLSNETSENETFETYRYSFDNAGHVTNEDVKTIAVPNSYGIITGDTGTTTATATLDSLYIAGTDSWITTAATTDTLSITHATPTTITPTAKQNQSLNFGSSFDIEDWHFDEKGHKDGLSTHSITLPSNSLTDSENGISDVVTSIVLSNANTGAFSTTHKNLGDLTLTGYDSVYNKFDNTMTVNQFATRVDVLLHGIDENLGATNRNVSNLTSRVDTIVNTTIPTAITTATNNAKTYTDGVINALKGDNLSEAFDTLKEIQEWINDGNQQGTALVNRVAAIENNLDGLTGSGSEGISSQITTAINDYDTSKDFGNIITYDASYFEEAGSAAAVQGDTTTTVEDLEDSLSDYLLTTVAANTYIALDDTFTYDNSDANNPIEMTVSQLVAYVKTLEDRIAALEGNGNEPTPQPSTPDVEIEFTEGVGSLTTGVFADVLTNIEDTNDLTYLVTVDNVEVPVVSQSSNGTDEIYINLNNDGTYRIVWSEDGTLTLETPEEEPIEP